MSRALVPLTDDFEEIEAITVIDVLRRGGIEVVTASTTGSRDVRGAHAVSVQADALIGDIKDNGFDAIILPGGPGSKAFEDCETLVEQLHRQRAEGRLIAAICAAPIVLTNLGIVEQGVHMTCYPSCMMDLDRASANVPVVADRTVITGQAPGSALLFALVVLKTLEGDSAARRVARGMVTDVLN